MLRLFLLAGICLGITACAQAKTPMNTVAQVDLQRYQGAWYEIANFPMFFQRQCMADTKAEYSKNPDGSIRVFNTCRTQDGSISKATGTAKVVEASNNSKLKVSFFKPFSGDYWIIGLDPDYRWAVVGAPDRKTLWILAREPKLSESDLQQAKQAAINQGYTLEKLQFTPHTGNTP